MQVKNKVEKRHVKEKEEGKKERTQPLVGNDS